MYSEIFSFPSLVDKTGILKIVDFSRSLKNSTDFDNYQMRTRFTKDNYIQNIGISETAGKIQCLCYHSGGFWSANYNTFEWRSHSKHPKSIKSISKL